MSEAASQKRLDIVELVVAHVERYGYQPSLREMAAALGVTRNAVACRLKALEALGLLERAGRDRGLRLLNVRFKARYSEEP